MQDYEAATLSLNELEILAKLRDALTEDQKIQECPVQTSEN